MTPHEISTLRAENEVKKYFEETVPLERRVEFWQVAAKKEPELVQEIKQLKGLIHFTEKDIQEHALMCKLFENKSKHLIRVIAIEIMIRKH